MIWGPSASFFKVKKSFKVLPSTPAPFLLKFIKKNKSPVPSTSHEAHNHLISSTSPFHTHLRAVHTPGAELRGRGGCDHPPHRAALLWVPSGRRAPQLPASFSGQSCHCARSALLCPHPFLASSVRRCPRRQPHSPSFSGSLFFASLLRAVTLALSAQTRGNDANGAGVKQSALGEKLSMATRHVPSRSHTLQAYHT